MRQAENDVARWRESTHMMDRFSLFADMPARPFVIAAFDQRFTPVAFVMVSLFCLAIHFYGLLPWKQSSGLAEEVTANAYRVSIY